MSMKLFFKYLFSKDQDDAVVKAFCQSLAFSFFSFLLSVVALIHSILS